MEKLSVLIPTYNNEAIIGQCLESVRWVDEIVIIDSLSTDNTVAICRGYTDKIFQQSFLGYTRQKNWGIAHCTHEWILQLDSDERLEAGLEQEIKQVLTAPLPGVEAYRLPRKNHVLGKWVRVAGIYPDYQTRLFRKTAGRFKERDVHEHLGVLGWVGTLQHHLMHDGMPNISKQLANLDHYTRYEANELYKRGKKFHGYQLLLRPPAIFAYRYLWQRGLLAGYRGFVLAVYLALYDFLTHAKLWEIEELNLTESPPR
jgi:glycosyltransferase involved in cell wall biosynthesis